MTTIPHRELRNNSSEILKRVGQGETFEITNHGDAVAALIPLQRDTLPPLRIRPASIVGRFDEIPSVESDESVQEILDDLRGER